MIHPDLALYRDSLPPASDPRTTPVVERRRRYGELTASRRGSPPDMASVETSEWHFSGRTIRYRRYEPQNGPRGIVLYAHGGSFVLGDLETHDALCRRIADDLGVILIAVEYRLAPEYPFPAGLDDVAEAMREVALHRSRYALKELPVIVMGDSAGATLVTVACRETRDDNLAIAAQALIYPTLGPEVVTDSSHAFGSGYFLEMDHLRADYESYLAGGVEHTDPRVSPLLADDLAGLPPAVVMVAECDPLRDEGVAYAGLLEHFGVEVELLEARGMVHGFVGLAGVIEAARVDLDDFADHVARFTLPESH